MSEKPTVLVTRQLPQPVETRLATRFRARLNADDRLYGRADLLAAADDADAILCCVTERFDAAVIQALPARVKVLATFSVGLDHIDLPAARARGLAVLNTPDVLSEATADIALLLILGAARRAREGEAAVREALWGVWRPSELLGQQLGGRRLAILGMGRIGRAVARRARGFGMEIHYCNRRRLAPESEEGARFHPRPESLLAVADVLSLHAPSTPETRRFLNRERIALMPEGAIVVNTARGDLIDDGALVAALATGRLFAAGLDVFDGEPDLHPAYRSLQNCFTLPHLGSATVETRVAMGNLLIDGLATLFAGGRPANAVG